MHQHAYIQKLKEEFKEIPFRKSLIPLPSGAVIQKASIESSVQNEVPYRNLIGSLLFLATRTRPDILFSVNLLSQYNNSPTITHWKLLNQVLNYIFTTENYSLSLDYNDASDLCAYTDASWASDRDDRKSFTGYMIFFRNIPITWRSSKQKCITLSTMEAEYIAMSETLKELLWYQNILREVNVLDILFKMPILYCDSQSAIYYAKNPVETIRTKHIDIRYHFVKELLAEKRFKLEKVPGKENIADMLTKGLSAEKIYFYNSCIFSQV